jgi:hypothetical protein
MSYKGPLDYIDVATRIVEFRTKHPEGSLQQVSYELVEASGSTFLIYTAAAYRSPDDARPGIGTAWEPVPGPTQFTRDSEMQNAETAAWGRAIVAALAADTKKGIASSEEIRNRQVDPPADPIVAAKNRLAAAVASAGIDLPEFMDWAVSDIDCDIRTADTETLDGLTRRVETEGKTMIGSTK